MRPHSPLHLGSCPTRLVLSVVAAWLPWWGAGCGEHPADDDTSAGPDDDTSVTDDTTDADDDSTEPGPVGPGPEFDGLCRGAEWQEGVADAVVGEAGHRYLGWLSGEDPFPTGTLETMKFVPPMPFHLTRVRAAYADGVGPVRLRLMDTLGRTYPAGWPDLDSEGANLVSPVEIEPEVDGGDPPYTEWDLSQAGVFLLPTQHYLVVSEALQEGGPTLAVEQLPSGESSRALLLLPGEDLAYGIDGNYRVELRGESFCTWSDEERWFAPATGTPFYETASSYTASADLDADGHADLVAYEGGPKAFLGDGAGGFVASPWDPFPDAPMATLLLFGDVDNDGDADAFAASYVGADDDGDGWTKAEGDCNDASTAVRPGASEDPDGVDEDCDGVADDGLDDTDADGDGVSILAGDCDDTRAEVVPGGTEVKDGLDNDCDQAADEDFHHRMLLNDGSGHFTTLASAGVEVLEPATACGFGDGDQDGFLDLYVGNWLEHYPDDRAVQDRYFEGNGDGTFRDALAEAGMELDPPFSAYGVTWHDWNDDALPDLLVDNYHLYDNQLWKNLGDGTFTDLALQVGVAHDEIETWYSQYPGGHTYGADFGDVDNDGDMDAYLANLSHPRTQPWADPSMFVVNQGAPDYTFVNEREQAGLIYDEGDINAQFADFDNDMDLDLAVASLYSQHFARLYRNDGGNRFTDVTYEAGVQVELAVEVLWLDVDEDGDEDLVVGDGWGEPTLNLFVNRMGQDQHRVDLLLEGTTVNRDAAGARVWLDAGGQTQVRQVQDGGGHWNSQRPRMAHFGLGPHTTIDAVRVRWGPGDDEVFTGITADGRFRLVQGTGIASPL